MKFSQALSSVGTSFQVTMGDNFYFCTLCHGLLDLQIVFSLRPYFPFDLRPHCLYQSGVLTASIIYQYKVT